MESSKTEPISIFYDVHVRCQNCLRANKVLVPVGISVEAHRPKCPDCGCSGYLWPVPDESENVLADTLRGFRK